MSGWPTFFQPANPPPSTFTLGQLPFLANPPPSTFTSGQLLFLAQVKQLFDLILSTLPVKICTKGPDWYNPHKIAGIYVLQLKRENPIQRILKVYVGRSGNVYRRLREHLRDIKYRHSTTVANFIPRVEDFEYSLYSLPNNLAVPLHFYEQAVINAVRSRPEQYEVMNKINAMSLDNYNKQLQQQNVQLGHIQLVECGQPPWKLLDPSRYWGPPDDYLDYLEDFDYQRLNHFENLTWG